MKDNIFPISMTVLWSIVFVSAMHSWTGICIGLCMGIAFGLFDWKKEEEKNENE